MSYIAGGTLKQYLGKPLPYDQAARLLLPISHALEYAHEHNVIHRDVKPANILMTETGEPMLSDFGIAKILELEEGQTLTETGVGIGTPEYMAPEQGSGKVDERADIYSLGVIFFELVTGRKPYTADTPKAVLIKQGSEPLPRPSSFVDGLPKKVEQVLFKALAKNPEDRYQTMGAFGKALEELGFGQIDQQATKKKAKLHGDETFDKTNWRKVLENLKNNKTKTLPDLLQEEVGTIPDNEPKKGKKTKPIYLFLPILVIVLIIFSFVIKGWEPVGIFFSLTLNPPQQRKALFKKRQRL